MREGGLEGYDGRKAGGRWAGGSGKSDMELLHGPALPAPNQVDLGEDGGHEGKKMGVVVWAVAREAWAAHQGGG